MAVYLGDVQRDDCQSIIPYPQRYLVVEEVEKGEQVLTFFPEPRY
ncbi:MAG: hypothetical protein QMC90_02135 [Dehalococcoidales bacterium]|nr:hypothetical protein [Dehalococcoidales bacterium]